MWAALPDRDKTLHAGDSDTNVVADAQGWMDYLIQRHKAIHAGTPISAPDAEIMKSTFQRLDLGRNCLAPFAKRKYRPLSNEVFRTLTNCRTAEDLLARRCPNWPVEVQVQVLDEPN